MSKIISNSQARLLAGLIVAVLFVCGAYIVSRQGILTIGSNEYKFVIADSTEERVKGLSGRDMLPENEAMLFVFERSGEHCFWMKDTRIPLDMIWLNEQKQVVHIEENVQPESYPKSFCPDEAALYVVEVNAGQVSASGIQEDQSVTF